MANDELAGAPALRIRAKAVDAKVSWAHAHESSCQVGRALRMCKVSPAEKKMKGFPRRFGPYALAKPLARGGMGALYLAVRGSEAQARVCVIKTVLPHLADKEYLQRFRDEGKVVVQLSHENLVPVFDSGQVGGEIYLGMNFIDGKDLRAIWNRCAKKGVAFPMDVAVFIVRELARGLDYAHTFGDIKLVHRDISPPNVLLSYDGSVKLTDFGLASSTLKMEKTAPGIIYGKVSYMSPEQARGEALDGRTDQFAAGIILWELLTGRQLYPAKAAAASPVAKPGSNAADPAGAAGKGAAAAAQRQLGGFAAHRPQPADRRALPTGFARSAGAGSHHAACAGPGAGRPVRELCRFRGGSLRLSGCRFTGHRQRAGGEVHG